MSAFIILGHGEETQINFNTRNKIPIGYKLVILAKCGTITQSDEVSRILKEFSNNANRDIFLNPEDHKREIEGFLGEKEIHVFTEGMSYPSLNVRLLADWEDVPEIPELNLKAKERPVVKSGLYKFPIDMEKWQLSNFKNIQKNIFGKFAVTGQYMPFVIKPREMTRMIYTNSIYPTPNTAHKMLNVSRSLHKFSEKITVPLEKLFEEGGPGVYYYVICRSSTQNNLNDYIDSLLIFKGDKPKNRIQLIPKLMPHMKNLANKTRRNGKTGYWSYEPLTEAPNKFKKLYNSTMKIRRNSIIQQQKQLKNNNVNKTISSLFN
jgi:hypothetical protein